MSSNNSNSAGGAQGGTAVPKGFRLKIQQMLAGLQTVLPDGSDLSVGGEPTHKADLMAEVQKMAEAYQTVDAAKLAAQAARLQLSGQLVGFHQELTAIKDALIAQLGRASPMLAQFGLGGRKPARPLSAAQKVVRAAKAKKTRVLRGTLSKKQKAAIQYVGALEVAVHEAAPAALPTAGETAAGGSTAATAHGVGTPSPVTPAAK